MLRIGVIGRPVHPPSFDELTRRVAGISLADLTNDELNSSDGESLVDFDAVWLRSREHAAETALRALASNKHVLVETASLAQLDWERIAAAGEEAKAIAFTADPLRFAPAVATVKEQLDSGKLGEPGLLRIHHWRNERDEPVSPIHACFPCLDLARWMFAQEPTQLYALTSPRGAPYLQLHLGFAGDGMALLDTWSLPQGEDYFSLSVIGSRGAAYADDHHNMQLLFRGGAPSALAPSQEADMQVGMLRAFVEMIERSTASDEIVSATNVIFRLAAAVETSLREQRVVEL